MKQVLQSLKNGITLVAEVPAPFVKSKQLQIKTSRTLISSGTERMLVDFGRAGWINKARQQPEKVGLVVNKIRTDGLIPTIDTVLNKLNQPLPLGYCNVGTVLEMGPEVNGFKVGDRVASNGKHAEIVNVPLNLCAKVPDSVSDNEAAFTVISAIALQGVRLAGPTLGETVVVVGLGLVGLITVQLLRANGCRVIGLDFDVEKLALAKKFGAELVNLSVGEDPVLFAMNYTRWHGVDAVIITASTKSNDPVHQAAQMSRKRGRIILVGVAGLELKRADFYEKELTFQVSCSYGPGRYDASYEEGGVDYPIGYVRWTEKRNFEAVLDMMADGRLNVVPLISHHFDIADALKGYELVASGEPSLGIILDYPTNTDELTLLKRTIALNTVEVDTVAKSGEDYKCAVSFIGAGNYATAVLMPAFKSAGVRLRSVASSGGVSGLYAGSRFKFDESTTDTNKLINDPLSDAVVITTQHNSHAKFVLQSLSAGKHVFVEKPLCLNESELNEIRLAYDTLSLSGNHPPLLMVGFNRRFAPQIQKIKELLAGVAGPKSFVMTVNAGAIPVDHWTQDFITGGGRIIGEACHFIDLLRFLAGESITAYSSNAMNSVTRDTVSIYLDFKDGSIGTVHYFANGNKTFPKERLEVFASGRILQLDNYRKLTGFGWPNFNKMNLWQQNKGQKECVNSFIYALKNNRPAPIDIQEIFEVSKVCIDLANSI